MIFIKFIKFWVIFYIFLELKIFFVKFENIFKVWEGSNEYLKKFVI